MAIARLAATPLASAMAIIQPDRKPINQLARQQSIASSTYRPGGSRCNSAGICWRTCSGISSPFQFKTIDISAF
jgi:hypothetical protein